MHTDTKGAAVKFPPPLVFVILLSLGYITDHYWPLPLSTSPWLNSLAALFIGSGISVALSAVWTLHRANTNIEPWQPTHLIVTSGIFSYSRNPIYLALFASSVGVSLWVNSYWLLLSDCIALYIVFHIAVKKEEHYLINKFPKSYQHYKQKVRRWL